MDDNLLKQKQQIEQQLTKREEQQEVRKEQKQLQETAYAQPDAVQVELPRGPEYIGTASKEEIVKKQAEFKNVGEQNRDYKFSDIAPKEPVTAEQHLERLSKDAKELLKGSDTFGDGADLTIIKNKLKAVDAINNDSSLSETEKKDHMVSAMYGLINSAERYRGVAAQQ